MIHIPESPSLRWPGSSTRHSVGERGSHRFLMGSFVFRVIGVAAVCRASWYFGGPLKICLQISTHLCESKTAAAGTVLPRILQAAPCYASFLQLGVCFGKFGGGFCGALCRLMAGTGLPGHGTRNRRRCGPQVKDCCHCSRRVVFGLPAYVDADFQTV